MLAHWFLSAILFLAATAVGFIVITSKMSRISKILVVLTLSLSSLYTYRALNDFYGYPVVLQKDFEDALVIGHMLDKENKVVHVWIKDPEEITPRSYTVPYSSKLAHFLEGMRDKHKGKPYRAKLETQSDFLSPLNRSIKEVDMSELMVFPPKN